MDRKCKIWSDGFEKKKKMGNIKCKWERFIKCELWKKKMEKDDIKIKKD
jgi:hypothetical protein